MLENNSKLSNIFSTVAGDFFNLKNENVNHVSIEDYNIFKQCQRNFAPI